MANCYDIIIIGAGLSGISAAYRVQTLLPSKSFAILEARSAIGGTWDLFKYPGLRSDSDLTTFGFEFEPWPEEAQISSGAKILNYIRSTAEKYGIDLRAKFNHRVTSTDWRSEAKRWEIRTEVNGQEELYYSKYVIWATGYYDHWEGLNPTIPGIQNFEGVVAHPQFWPQDLDYTDKKVVIIGSGATAITLLPVISKTAAYTTMLQRSPTYILPLATKPVEDRIIRSFLPTWLAKKVLRWKNIMMPRVAIRLCKMFPDLIRVGMKKLTTGLLPLNIPFDPHFKPKYRMGEQRICLAPDGDFFKALHTGKAGVATGTIRMITPKGIELDSGERLDTDVIVTATGLKIQVAGGARISVDGKEVVLGKKHMWNGVMLEDVPNMAILIGYMSTAWTVGCDVMAQTFVRVIQETERKGKEVVKPRADLRRGEVGDVDWIEITATYVKSAIGKVPLAGTRGPWRKRRGYVEDWMRLTFGDLTQEVEWE